MASVPQFTDAAQPEQEWKDLLEMILPPQGEWTEEEYQHILCVIQSLSLVIAKSVVIRDGRRGKHP